MPIVFISLKIIGVYFSSLNIDEDILKVFYLEKNVLNGIKLKLNLYVAVTLIFSQDLLLLVTHFGDNNDGYEIACHIISVMDLLYQQFVKIPNEILPKR